MLLPRPQACRRTPRSAAALIAGARACGLSEVGDTMIEVVVAALLLALVAAATLTGYVAVSHTSADQRDRVQADQLAQADQDRLRGLTVAELGGTQGNQSVTTTLDNVVYTVTSKSTFIATTGSTSCGASGTSNADEVAISSTVSWGGANTMGRAPVVEHGLVTPQVGGALIVQVLDNTGAGVAGMTVTPTGASSPTPVSTDSSGCAVFGALTGGSYNVSVAKSGYVDANGNSTPPAAQQATTVTPTVTDTMSFEFAPAGTLSASFQTLVGGALRSSSADTIVAFQNQMAQPYYRVFGTSSTLLSNTYSSTVSSGATVFPFLAPYTVYAGSCTGNAPSANGQSSDPSVTVPAGGSASTTLRLPAMIVRVWSGTSASPGSLVSSAPHVTLTDTTCAGAESYPASTVPTATQGALADPGQPYGSYTVCADNGVHRNTATVANTNPAGPNYVDIYLGTGASGLASGTCT